MRHPSTRLFFGKAALPFAAVFAFALTACGEREEVTVETDVEDLGGGELIVRDADEPGVEVNLPETPMTPVPAGAAEAEAEGGEEAAAE